VPFQQKTSTSLPLASFGWNSSPLTRILIGFASMWIVPLVASAVTGKPMSIAEAKAPDRNGAIFPFM
jgi:hypothetical protein